MPAARVPSPTSSASWPATLRPARFRRVGRLRALALAGHEAPWEACAGWRSLVQRWQRSPAPSSGCRPCQAETRAFASWTAAPNGMSPQESADAAASCRKEQKEPAAEYADKLSSAQAVIAERCGVWTTVVLADTEGFSALCITDSSTGLFGDAMIGSVGTAIDGSGLGPRELTAKSVGVGSMNGRELSLAAGLAGPDIVAVTYRSTTHGPVAATVSQGHFAFWLPGADAELEAASSRGVDVDVTYRDGSTGTSRLTL